MNTGRAASDAVCGCPGRFQDCLIRRRRSAIECAAILRSVRVRRRGSRCRGGIAPSPNERRAPAHRPRAARAPTLDPMPTAHSTRPPAVTICAPSPGCPAWKILPGRRAAASSPRSNRRCGSGPDSRPPPSTTPSAARESHCGFALVERAGERGLAQADQVALQPHQDRLGLRVAEAAVELEHVRRAVRRRSSGRHRGIPCRECRRRAIRAGWAR